MQRTRGVDDKAGPDVVAGLGPQQPCVGGIVEHGRDDVVVEGDCVRHTSRSADRRDVDHRNLVRFHSSRAIGPIRPTSCRNAANGAKPTCCDS